MFNIGDKVVHPLHGAGVVVAIEEKSILNERQSYYIIKMPGEVKVMVPIAKAVEIGVRNIIDKVSAMKVINILEKESTEMSMNWNKRYRDNMERMKTGNICASVETCSYFKTFVLLVFNFFFFFH